MNMQCNEMQNARVAQCKRANIHREYWELILWETLMLWLGSTSRSSNLAARKPTIANIGCNSFHLNLVWLTVVHFPLAPSFCVPSFYKQWPQQRQGISDVRATNFLASRKGSSESEPLHLLQTQRAQSQLVSQWLTQLIIKNDAEVSFSPSWWCG